MTTKEKTSLMILGIFAGMGTSIAYFAFEGFDWRHGLLAISSALSFSISFILFLDND